MRTPLIASALLLACSHAAPAPGPQAAQGRDWIARSNQDAQVLLEVRARFAPEFAARTGLPGIDDRISDFAPGHLQRQREAVRQAIAILEQRQKAERDPDVQEDLAILLDSANREVRGSELREKLEVPYANLPRLMFASVRALLEPQVAAERHPAALARVRKYAGLEPGYRPAVELAEAEAREGFQKGLLPPSRIEVENDLHTAQSLIDGIDKLFAEYPIAGAEQPVATLRRQLEGHLQFVR